MIKDILVCLEGSASSEAATRMSIDIAQRGGARLTGLAIVDEPDIRAATPTSIGGTAFKHERDESLLADARRNAADWLVLFESRCRDAGVEGRVQQIVGRPAESILAEMEAHDLTVMGRDANFRFETADEDSETRRAVLRGSPRPVLLVPETAVPPLGAVVLVAYDGSGAAKRAIASFAASGLAASRQVHVGTVDDRGVAAREMADEGAYLLRTAGVPAKSHNVVSVLTNAEALVKLSVELGAGLMVMGAFAHSRLAQLFVHSATRGLIETTAIPLYLQH